MTTMQTWSKTRTILTVVAALTAGIAASGCAAAPDEETPEASAAAVTADYTAPGPSKVAVKSGTDGDGRRLRVFVPQSAPRPSGFGAVIFAHGFQLAVDDYDALLTHVASWGYVVFSVDYAQPFIGMDHRDVGDVIASVGRAVAAGETEGLPHIDPQRVAVAGHSLGGKAAVMAALEEPAFKAVLALDPVDGAPGNPLGGEGSAKLPILVPTAASTLAQPALFVGAEWSHCKKPIFLVGGQACAPSNRDAGTFYRAATSSAARYELELADFGHIDFLDRPVGGLSRDVCVHARADRTSRSRALRGVSVAFLARHLDGDASAASWLTGVRHDQLVASGALVAPAAPARACP